jgi:hypothetical protein
VSAPVPPAPRPQSRARPLEPRWPAAAPPAGRSPRAPNATRRPRLPPAPPAAGPTARRGSAAQALQDRRATDRAADQPLQLRHRVGDLRELADPGDRGPDFGLGALGLDGLHAAGCRAAVPGAPAEPGMVSVPTGWLGAPAIAVAEFGAGPGLSGCRALWGSCAC